MRLASPKRARVLAGAFCFLGAAAVCSAERLRFAAERPDKACTGMAPPHGVVTLAAGESPSLDYSGCLIVLPVPDLSDAGIADASAKLAKLPETPGVILDLSAAASLPEAERATRLTYAVKVLSSAGRAAAKGAPIAVGLPGADPSAEGYRAVTEVLAGEELAPYVDAAWVSAEAPRESWPRGSFARLWTYAPLTRGVNPQSAALRLAFSARDATLVALTANPEWPLSVEGWHGLVRLQAYLTDDVSADPTPTSGSLPDGTPVELARFFDAKRNAPILLLTGDPPGRASIELSGGPFEKADVEMLATGATRTFEIHGAPRLALELSRTGIAVRLTPIRRPDAAAEAVDIGAVRGLTAEEIVARTRAWEAGMVQKSPTYTADMTTSLRFRVAEVNETFDLTIRGPFFQRRGEPSDWAWRESFVNGVRWKGRSLPKIPILQPEKVAVLPLEIRLTEDYSYKIKDETTMDDRPVYVIEFAPREDLPEKPVYRGTAWIDKETFALRRREEIQLNLKGDVLSNVRNEYFRPIPGREDVWLPVEIRGQQVFSTAGRTTNIESEVKLADVVVDPPDFDDRRKQAYASELQMVRDTEQGLRYLIPDPEVPGGRIVEWYVSRKSTFGLLGTFYDDSLDYPIPLIGLQHFNFDLWKKGKQVTVFYGGVLVSANYTDPSLLGSRFDLGADLFATAFPFGDPAYKGGEEVPGEKINRLPALLQVNFGRPLGTYLKASVGFFARHDNYTRDEETASDFVTPTDGVTLGGEFRLVGNWKGYTATLKAEYADRLDWEPWGVPGSGDYDPQAKDFLRYSLVLAKDQFFPGFRKLHLGVSYLGGQDLDRFSRYEFGSFSAYPMRGFKNGSVKAEEAVILNVSYGLNIQEIIRFEGFLDQAWVFDDASGFDSPYFAGIGLLASLNGPWENSIIRGEVGYPIVSQGIGGFVVNLILLKLF